MILTIIPTSILEFQDLHWNPWIQKGIPRFTLGSHDPNGNIRTHTGMLGLRLESQDLHCDPGSILESQDSHWNLGIHTRISVSAQESQVLH